VVAKVVAVAVVVKAAADVRSSCIELYSDTSGSMQNPTHLSRVGISVSQGFCDKFRKRWRAHAGIFGSEYCIGNGQTLRHAAVNAP